MNLWESWTPTGSLLAHHLDLPDLETFRRRKLKEKVKYEPDLTLFPEPHLGRFATARLLLLGANPYGSSKNMAEHARALFRRAALQSLRQREDASFFYLRPEFHSFDGFRFWGEEVLALVHKGVIRRRGLTNHEAWTYLANRTAAAELYGYHSKGCYPSPELLRMPSSAYAHDLIRTAMMKDADLPVVLIWSSSDRLNKWKRILGPDRTPRLLQLSENKLIHARSLAAAQFDRVVDYVSSD